MSRKNAAKLYITAEDQSAKAFKSAGASLDSLAKKAGGLALPALGGGIGAGVMVKESVAAFATYESAAVDMARVTDDSYAAIASRMQKLPGELGGPISLIKGYYEVLSAGIEDEVDAQDTLVTSAKLSKLAHLEHTTAIQTLTKMMAGYGDEIEDVTEASDSLIAIEKLGQTKVAELAPYIGGLAGMSHNLSISLDELGGSFAQITQTAGSTSQASTRYEAVLVALQKPSKTMAQMLKKMGYETAQAAIEELGFIGALKRLDNEAHKSKKQLSELFGEKEALMGITALAADNYELASRKIDGMGNKAGKTKKAFELWKTTMGGLYDISKGLIEKYAILAGTELAPVLKEWLESGIALMENNRELVKIKLHEWVGETVSKLEMLAKHRETLVRVFKVTVMAVIVTKLYALAAAIKAVTLALVSFSSSNPIGLGILGALAIGGSVYLGVKALRDDLDHISKLKFDNTNTIKGSAHYTDESGYMAHTLQRVLSAAKDRKEREGLPLEELWNRLLKIASDDAESLARFGVKLSEVRKAYEGLYEAQTKIEIKEKPALVEKEESPWGFKGVPMWGEGGDPKVGLMGFDSREKDDLYKRAKERQNLYQNLYQEMSDTRLSIKELETQRLGTYEEQELALEKIRYENYIEGLNQRYGAFSQNADLIELAQQEHSLIVEEIQRRSLENQKEELHTFASRWTDYLLDMTRRSGNAFDTIFDDFKSMLTRMALESAVFALFDAGLPGSGSFLSSFTSSFKGGFSSIFGGFRAEGGDVSAGKAYMVGEKGKPELFVPGLDGTIIPLDKLGSAGKSTIIHDNRRTSITIKTAEKASAMDAYRFAELYREADDKELLGSREVVNGY